MDLATRHLHWIDGQWCNNAPSDSPDATFEVTNPETDRVIASASRGTASEVDRAVTSAAKAFEDSTSSTPSQRQAWLLAAANAIEQDADAYRALLIHEIGSPIAKANQEIETAARYLRCAAASVWQTQGKVLATDQPNRRSQAIRCPLGVVAAFPPFNVPLIKAVKQSAMALATGNTCVMLPSPQTPGLVCRLAETYAQAGLPSGFFNVVLGLGTEIGDSLTGHPGVAKVLFTGSSAVGRHVAVQCAKSFKPITLEMGGKNALVVCEDADVELAARLAALSAFLYQGQICMSASRILVHQSQVDSFGLLFAAQVQNLAMGDLTDPSTVVGPIIHAKQRKHLRTLLSEAIDAGAQVQLGGQWEGNRLRPTVLTQVPNDIRLYHDEVFGPVSIALPFATDDEAIQRVNESRYGLVASVFTDSVVRSNRYLRELNVGMVHVNGPTIAEEPTAPFGGWGESGLGRESVDADFSEMTRWKWVSHPG